MKSIIPTCLLPVNSQRLLETRKCACEGGVRMPRTLLSPTDTVIQQQKTDAFLLFEIHKLVERFLHPG